MIIICISIILHPFLKNVSFPSSRIYWPLYNFALVLFLEKVKVLLQYVSVHNLILHLTHIIIVQIHGIMH